MVCVSIFFFFYTGLNHYIGSSLNYRAGAGLPTSPVYFGGSVVLGSVVRTAAVFTADAGDTFSPWLGGGDASELAFGIQIYLNVA